MDKRNQGPMQAEMSSTVYLLKTRDALLNSILVCLVFDFVTSL